MIRVAAVGDVHFDEQSQGRIRKHASLIADQADIFLLAGDLTQTGSVEEAYVLAKDLENFPIPVVAVLGNHDYHRNQEDEMVEILGQAGVRVLEGETEIIQVRNRTVGIAGLKGFGGGFFGACGSEFGEPEMKSFIRHTKDGAHKLRDLLLAMQTDYRIALLHYSPVPDTLMGERKEIYPFLGSYLLAEAIDQGKADIAFHGHAHKGVEKGKTFGGIPVRNVAQPVIQHICNTYALHNDDPFKHEGIGLQTEVSAF